jgi:organic radical activating enzyme
MIFCYKVPYEEIFSGPMMSMFVISACNLQCRECIMMSQMHQHPSYQMSLEELEKFIYYTEKSNYKFHYRYTGGEPLYWRHLEEGTSLIRKSKSCKSILLMTNGMAYNKLTPKILSMIDYVRISQYGYNKEAIKYLKTKHPYKVRIVDREEFYPMPESPIHDATPVECGNPEHIFFHGKVYACPHAYSIAIKNNLTHIETGVDLQYNYCSSFEQIRHSQEEICKLCISNRKVASHMQKIQNLSKYHQKLVQIDLHR